MEPTGNYHWSDWRSVQPVLTVEASEGIPDGTYSVTCSGSDEAGNSLNYLLGFYNEPYYWSVTVTVQGGVVTSSSTQSTGFFSGLGGYKPGTSEYSQVWQWTKEGASYGFPPGSSVEADIAPLYIPILRGEGCGTATTAVIQQSVTLRIRCSPSGCEGGGCLASDSPGTVTTRTASLHVSIGLGERYDQRGSGSLTIDAFRPDHRFSKRERLRIPEGFRKQYNNNGVFPNYAAEVIEGATVAAHLYPDDLHRYRIDFYERDKIDWTVGPGCAFTGPPN